jgi:2-C-methyl-D-erythritol 4-phosphate cytidylyltransferase
VLLAAGSGARVGGDVNKVFLPLAGRRVFTWSLRWATELPNVARVLLVVSERDVGLAHAVLAREAPSIDVELVIGGASRHGSEWEALQVLAPAIEAGELDVVVIHDAARPLAGTATFADVIEAAASHGGALPVRPQPSLVAVDTGQETGSAEVVAVQTPQGFRAGDLLSAYRAADADGFIGTDTASCVERFCDLTVRCIQGSASNIKITFPEDLFLAEHLLSQAHWDLSGRKGGAQ